MQSKRIVEAHLGTGLLDERMLFAGIARVVAVGAQTGIVAYVEVTDEPRATDGPLSEIAQTEIIFRVIHSGGVMYDRWTYAGTVSDKSSAVHVYYLMRSLNLIGEDDAPKRKGEPAASPPYPPI